MTSTPTPNAAATTESSQADAASSADANAHHFETEHLHADLKGRSIRGGAITLGAQGVKFVLQLTSTVVLARLLTPADFGLIAMVTALTGFVQMFKDAGLSMATVQRDQVNHAQVSTLFWVNVALSAVLMLLVAALAPAVAWFYGEPELVWVTLAISATFILGGLTVQHMAILKRQMRFTALAVKDIAAMAAGVAVAITMALLGFGYWALVAMPATSALVSMIAVWTLTRWTPGLPRRGTGVRPMLAFGGNLTGFNFVNYFSRNADNVLIGWFWGAATLGLYSKAYGLLMLPITQLKAPLTSVAVPALSRLQNDPERYERYYVKAMKLLMWAVGPGVAVFAAVAPDLIHVVLGEQWVAAVPIFQVLALTALFQPLYSSAGMIFTSYGRTDRMLRFGLFTAPLFTISFIIGLPFGAIGVAAAYAAFFLVALPFLLAYTYRGTPVRLSAVARAILLPGMVSAVLFTTALAGSFALPASSAIEGLAISGAAVVGVSLLLLSFRCIRDELRSLLADARALR